MNRLLCRPISPSPVPIVLLMPDLHRAFACAGLAGIMASAQRRGARSPGNRDQRHATGRPWSGLAPTAGSRDSCGPGPHAQWPAAADHPAGTV